MCDLVAKDLLLQFVERLIALRVVELSRLHRIGAEDRKQFVLAGRRTLSVVAVGRTDHDRHLGLAAGGEHKFRRLNDKLAVEHRSSHADERLARRKRCFFGLVVCALDQLLRRQRAQRRQGCRAVSP